MQLISDALYLGLEKRFMNIKLSSLMDTMNFTGKKRPPIYRLTCHVKSCINTCCSAGRDEHAGYGYQGRLDYDYIGNIFCCLFYILFEKGCMLFVKGKEDPMFMEKKSRLHSEWRNKIGTELLSFYEYAFGPND